jgi:hypothetical protein
MVRLRVIVDVLRQQHGREKTKYKCQAFRIFMDGFGYYHKMFLNWLRALKIKKFAE